MIWFLLTNCKKLSNYAETVKNSLFLFLLGGLDTEEPWQGTWSGGVFVECVGKQEGEEPASVTRPVTPPPKQQQQANSRVPPKQQQTSVESSEGQNGLFKTCCHYMIAQQS